MQHWCFSGAWKGVFVGLGQVLSTGVLLMMVRLYGVLGKQGKNFWFSDRSIVRVGED